MIGLCVRHATLIFVLKQKEKNLKHNIELIRFKSQILNILNFYMLDY